MGVCGCGQLCLTPGLLWFVQTSPQATAPAFGGRLRQASWMSAASGAVTWEGWRCTVLPSSLRNQPALSAPSATLTCPRLRRYVCMVGMQSFLSALSDMGGGDTNGNSVLCFLDDRSKDSNATDWMAYTSILQITCYWNLSFSLPWTIWHLEDSGKQGLNLSKLKLPSEASLPNSIQSLSYQCGNDYIYCTSCQNSVS